MFGSVGLRAVLVSVQAWGLVALAIAQAAGQTTAAILLNAREMTGGVRTLDRGQFFNYHGTLVPPGNTNLGNLRQETWSEQGLNLATGRTSTELDQFIANGLPEDPSRPGYIDPTAARNRIQGDYRNFVLNGTRWEANRMHPDAPFVQNGRNGGFWPDYLDSGTQMPTNFEAYADFLNVYFEEAVYGPNAFLPVESGRFYFEVMNEPQWTSAPWSDVIEMHQVVTERVKEVFPQLPIGGTGSGDKFQGGGANSWAEMRDLMDDMTTWQTPSGTPVQLDFWTIHNYERYTVKADGSYSQDIHHSPGHVAAIMDLFENYSNNVLGDPKRFAITEYGSWNRTERPNGDYGSYARDEQQWDMVRNIREQLLVYMDRPDRIINATPFVSPRHWQNAIPTNEAGDNVFWEQDATGDWVETIVAETFRMYSDVRGEYVPIELGHPDLQAVAFREGSKLHVLLNNLRTTSQQLDLSALGAEVASASLTRTFRGGGQNFYLPDVDVSSSWRDLILEGEAGAVLTLNLEGPEVYDQALDSRTFYGADTELPISTQAFLQTTIDADTTDAVSAKLRFGYSVPTGSLPTFTVRVNGSSFTVTGDPLELDDNDFDLVMREIDVPVGILNDGPNDISFFFPFPGANGEISAAVLEVTRSVGDFNGNARLDSADLDTLYARFGAAAPGDRFDLDADGQLGPDDAAEWLGLRNVVAGDLDVDGDIDSRDAVGVLANLGTAGTRPEWSRGNTDADGDVDPADLLTVLNGFTGDIGGAIDGVTLDGVEANPGLVYDPATGELWLAPTGIQVLAFSVTATGELSGTADFSELDAAAAGAGDTSDSQVGWVSSNLSAGGGVDGFDRLRLGVLAPLGLDDDELQAFLGSAIWAGDGVGGQLDLVLTPLLPGDFDGDGVVGPSDYTIYRDTFGSTSDLRADANRDGRVGADDYAVWVANYGQTAGASLAVPEPSVIGLLTLGCLAAGHRHREFGA